jgi:phenylacetate-CoA ligase
MIYDWKMSLYWRLPVRLQEAIASVYAAQLEKVNYGPVYDEWRRRFHSWQNFSRADAEAWQNTQLTYIVHLAATRVPYYRKRWQAVAPQAIQTVADLPKLPRLAKQELRQHEQCFLAEGSDPLSLMIERTSGTTGTALQIYRPKAMQPKWWALYEMCRTVAGVSRDVPQARLIGRPIIRGDTTRPPYWRYNRRWRQLNCSSYHVSRETAPHYIVAMRQYGSQWIEGYGSAIAALAESAMEAGIPPLPLRAAIVSGDTLLPGMRASIETFFQCKCYDHYGQSEGVCMAMECPHGRMHILPAAGIVEILREDGLPCAPGEVGEVVATGLLNDAMPLIRYRLEDYAAWAEDQECPCGNVHPILAHLAGRLDDYLITTDGRKIGRLSTAVKRSPTVHSAQVVQDQPGHAYLLVRPSNGYQPADAIAIRDDILERVGRFAIEVVEVPEIPKTLQGKTLLVVRLEERVDMWQLYKPLLKKKA